MVKKVFYVWILEVCVCEREKEKEREKERKKERKKEFKKWKTREKS